MKKTYTVTGIAALLVLIYALATGKLNVTDVSVTVEPAAATSSAAAVSSEAASEAAVSSAAEATSEAASSAAPVTAIQ